MRIHRIKMVAHYQDNGDGSGTTSLYNSQEQMKAQLINSYGWSEDRWQGLLDEDDPYENGSLSSTTLEITVNEEGGVMVRPFHVHSGNQ